MNRTGFALALVAALALAAPAQAAWDCTTPGVCTETQTASGRAAPSITTATDWISLSGIKFIRVEVCAEATRTLSGTGNLHAYLKGTSAADRNPSLDLPVNVSTTACAGSACRCQLFPDMQVGVGVGEFMFAASSVGISAGTNVVVKIWLVK